MAIFVKTRRAKSIYYRLCLLYTIVMLKSIPTTFISTNADTFMIHYFSSFVVMSSRNRMEEYPSG